MSCAFRGKRVGLTNLFATCPALLVLSCSGAPSKDARVQSGTTPPPAALPAGGFLVIALDAATSTGTRFLAQAGDGCAFEFEIAGATSSGKGQFDFAFAPAALVRRPDADCTDFLRRLAPELGHKGTLPGPPRSKRLDLTLTVLGSHQSRSTDHPQIAGSFSSSPPGKWTATKLFLADGEGEVFLNFNLEEGLGEFSYKDSDYASTVVNELAKILLP